MQNYWMIIFYPTQQSWSETNKRLDLWTHILIELLYNQFMKPIFAVDMQRVTKIGIGENVVKTGLIHPSDTTFSYPPQYTKRRRSKSHSRPDAQKDYHSLQSLFMVTVFPLEPHGRKKC